jgi:hypothetical protein
MREGLYLVFMTCATLALVLSQSPEPSYAADATPSPKDVAVKLDAALKAADSLRDPENEIALFRTAAAEALKTIPANVFVKDLFQKIEQSKTTDSRKLAKEWQSALMEARDILQFEIVEESPLPDGFPEPTPVGEIRLQQYPKYRLARTDMTFLEGSAFWTLFNHIKERDIAMTAPVEMTYATEGNAAPKKSAMSFMYRSTRQGQLGAAGKVEVVDIPAQMAVSIGIRGDATKERVADAKRRLEGWLEAHRDEYESSGPLRVMGYNSPFVADKKQFAEVQIPVRMKPPVSPVKP